ncbi:hypothetical protein HDU76_008288, partial [Blyttiomyces sp. JEL0837]
LNGPVISGKPYSFHKVSAFTAAKPQPASVPAANGISWPNMFRVGDVVWVNTKLSNVKDLGVVQVFRKRGTGRQSSSTFANGENDVVFNVDLSPLSKDFVLWPAVVRRNLSTHNELQTAKPQTTDQDLRVDVVYDRVLLEEVESSTHVGSRTIRARASTVSCTLKNDLTVRVYEVELFGCSKLQLEERKYFVSDVVMTPAAAHVLPPEWNPLLDEFLNAVKEDNRSILDSLDSLVCEYLKALTLFRDHGMSAVNLFGKHENMRTPMLDGVDLKHWSYKSLQWGHEMLNIGDVVRVRRSAITCLSEEVQLPALAVDNVIPDDQMLIEIVAIEWTRSNPNVVITGIRCHVEDCEDHPDIFNSELVQLARRDFQRPYLLCGVRTAVNGEERLNGTGLKSRNVEAVRKQQLVTIPASHGLLGRFYGVLPSVSGFAKLKWLDRVVRNVQDGILPVKNTGSSGRKNVASNRVDDDDESDGFEQVDLSVEM